MEFHRKALLINEVILDQPRSESAAIYHNNVGTVLYELGNYQEAYEALQRSYQIRSTAFGKDHQDTKSTLCNITAVIDAMERKKPPSVAGHEKAGKAKQKGHQFYENGEYAKALVHFQQALATFEKGSDLRVVSSCCNNISYAHHKLGNHAQAITFAQRALETAITAGTDQIETFRDILQSFQLAQALSRLEDVQIAMTGLDALVAETAVVDPPRRSMSARPAKISSPKPSASPHPTVRPEHKTTCVICLEKPPVMALTPCGHCCLCEDDIAMFVGPSHDRACPICMTEVTGHLRVYFP